MKVAYSSREATTREATFNAIELAKIDLKSAVSSKDFTDSTAQAIKGMCNKNGYSIADMISVARPILNQLAADKGIQLSHSDLDNLENSLTAIEADSKVVSIKDKKKSRGENIFPTTGGLRQDRLQSSPAAEEETVKPKRLPMGRAAIAQIQEELKELINENLDAAISQGQEGLLTKAAPNQWAEKYQLTAAGSLSSFLKNWTN